MTSRAAFFVTRLYPFILWAGYQDLHLKTLFVTR